MEIEGRQLYLLFHLVTGILAVNLPFTTHDNGKLRVSTSYLISFFTYIDVIEVYVPSIESLRAKLNGKNKSKTIYQIFSQTPPCGNDSRYGSSFFLKEIRDIIRYRESETLTGVNLHFGHKWRSVRIYRTQSIWYLNPPLRKSKNPNIQVEQTAPAEVCD